MKYFLSDIQFTIKYNDVPKNNITAKFLIEKMYNDFCWFIPISINNIHMVGCIKDNYTFQFIDITNIDQFMKNKKLSQPIKDKIYSSLLEFRLLNKFLSKQSYALPKGIKTNIQLKQFIHTILLKQLKHFLNKSVNDVYINIEIEQLYKNVNHISNRSQTNQCINDIFNFIDRKDL